MSDPELSPLEEPGPTEEDNAAELPELGDSMQLADLDGDLELPGAQTEGDPLDEAIAELQDVLGKDQELGPLEHEHGAGNTAHSQTADDGGMQGLVMSLPVQLDVMIGSADMPVSELIAMETGSIVALNRKIGEPVEICVNGTRVATGEIQTLDDNPSQLGVKIIALVQA